MNTGKVKLQDISWDPPEEYKYLSPDRLTIGCPFYQAKWCWEEFSTSILDLDYPKKLIDIIWVDNKSTDGMVEELNKFKRKYKREYSSIKIFSMPRARVGHKRWRTNIINCCNLIRTKRDQSTDLVLLGSDCIPPSNGLWKLSDMKYLKGDICGGITIIFGARSFSPGSQSVKIFPSFTGYYQLMDNGMFALVPFAWDSKSGQLILEQSYMQKVIRVMAIGTGFCLITKEVLDKISWKPDMQYGEDLRFCYDAHNLGFNIYMDTSLWYDHLHYRYIRMLTKKDGKIISWKVKFLGNNIKRTRWSYE